MKSEQIEDFEKRFSNDCKNEKTECEEIIKLNFLLVDKRQRWLRIFIGTDKERPSCRSFLVLSPFPFSSFFFPFRVHHKRTHLTNLGKNNECMHTVMCFSSI